MEDNRKKILITGATGYIGRRLTGVLQKRNDLVLRLLVRNRNKVSASVQMHLEVVEGDTFDQQSLETALEGIHTAFYLIHSMGADKNFEQLDRISAENFINAAINAGVKRIIYLGGLGVKETASKHLLSRIETGDILSSRPDEIEVIWIRAGVIIGSGSTSFEIIFNLVHKLPLMVTPRWVATKTQPIGVDDVLAYLESSIDLPHQGNLVVDIGSETMSFKAMMLQAADAMDLKRWMLQVPVLSPRLSSYWLILFTPVPYRVASALVDGLKSETVVQNDHAARYFSLVHPMPYKQTVLRAMEELEQRQVISRWCDSSGGEACDISEHDDPAGSILRDIQIVPLDGTSPAAVYKAACDVGGKNGWFTYSFLWQLRGLIDKLVGGYGLNRGRRTSNELRLGDAIDFWKVVDLKENKRLLLHAQMKLPGKAWLEFDIQPHQLIQTAHFIPNGLWGRIYWYSVIPLHTLVFPNLAKQLIKTARKIESK